MENLTLFLKSNKKIKENAKYKATKSLLDENGEALEWEIRPITTRLNDEIRLASYKRRGKTEEFDADKYVENLITASVVYPDLYNAELQDSYGVSKPNDLLKELLDNPSEYNDFAEFIQHFNGFDTNVEEKVEEAKN